MDKCRDEKTLEVFPVGDFIIKKITGREDKAFLSAELTKSDETHTVNYEMVKVYNPFPFVVYKLKSRF